MADKKKDKVKVRDLKPNKDAKGGGIRFAAASGGAHAANKVGASQVNKAGSVRGI
jgi:hypothetical protein